MTDTTETDAPATDTVGKMILAYRRIRDKKLELTAKMNEEIEKLDEKLGLIEQELLRICKETGQTSGSTPYGRFTRTLKTKYWTNNWPAMYKMIVEQNAPQLLEQRLHQTNFRQFITDHPEFMPEGLNVDSSYAITVYKPTNKPV